MDIFRAYTYKSVPLQIVLVSGLAFILIFLANLFSQFAGFQAEFRGFMFWLELPTDFMLVLYRPWTLITHIFVHYPNDFWSFLFRMLIVYQLGTLLLTFRSPGLLWHLFIFGGLSGAILHVISYALISLYSTRNGYLHGSAPAVLAIVAGLGTLLPDFKVRLFIFGEVALKWIAIVYIAIDFASLNMNGIEHIFHIGGAFYGFLYMRLYRTGFDLQSPWKKLISWFQHILKFRNKYPINPKIKTTYSPSGHVSEAELDALLDKVSKKGYAALSQNEKQRLEQASRQTK